MLKNALLKCSLLLDRDDLYKEISSSEKIEEILNNQIKNDILKLINCYNFISNFIYEKYIDLVCVDTICSDSDRNIYFDFFSHKPIKIISAKHESIDEYFSIFTNHIQVKTPNKKYMIEYKYVPCEVCNFDDEIICEQGLSDDILAMGIVAKFLASKGKFNESEYWNDKFMFKLFSLSSKKERRLKSHFNL